MSCIITHKSILILVYAQFLHYLFHGITVIINSWFKHEFKSTRL